MFQFPCANLLTRLCLTLTRQSYIANAPPSLQPTLVRWSQLPTRRLALANAPLQQPWTTRWRLANATTRTNHGTSTLASANDSPLNHMLLRNRLAFAWERSAMIDCVRSRGQQEHQLAWFGLFCASFLQNRVRVSAPRLRWMSPIQATLAPNWQQQTISNQCC